MRDWDMILKRGILRNSAMSDDCEAAMRALGTERASTPSATSDIHLEFGLVLIYTEIPLLQGELVVPSSCHDVGDTDSLLTLVRAGLMEQTRRVEECKSKSRQCMSTAGGPRLLRP